MAFPAFLGFKISTGEVPWITLQEEIHGEIWDLILLSNLCATPPPPPSSHQLILIQKRYLLGI